MTPTAARPDLPELPLAAWEPTKTTLHLWAQIVGKTKLAATAPRNHWWNVPLYLDVRGLTTRRLHHAKVTFQIDFDFVDHRLVTRTNRGQQGSFRLQDGLSVASFDRQLHQLLDQLGVDVAIREDPYGVPMTTPFPNDTEHAAYDPEYVRRFWQVLDWVDTVLEEFSGWYCGKQSPVHLFWHSFDLAVTRFSGRRAPTRPNGKALSTYITERFDEFSRSQKDVARYIVDHLDEAAFLVARGISAIVRRALQERPEKLESPAFREALLELLLRYVVA